MLLEGPHLVQTALECGTALEVLLVEAGQRETFAALLERAGSLGVEVREVEPALLREGSDVDSPRGLLALASVQRPDLAELKRRAVAGRVLYLDAVQDPGNVGALIRSAAASGCAAVVAAPGSCSWRNPRAVRASAGAALRLPLLWGAAPEQLRELVGDTAPWLTLAAHGGTPLWSATLPPAGVLVVGSEAHGVSAAANRLATHRLTIPLVAGVESLNAAVAASVVLFEWRRRGPSDALPD